MKDSTRESLSYFGLYWRLFRAKKRLAPQAVSFGDDRDQYFLYYEPPKPVSDIVVAWVHGGGWNAGTPRFFDFVGQCVAGAGYRFVSLGYRLSPKHKYPAQIEDVCRGYAAAMAWLKGRSVDISRVVVSGPSAGAHLAAILCTSETTRRVYGADVSNVIGFIGVGGPYGFDGQPLSVRLLLDQLFAKGYDRRLGEPCALMEKSGIPMLLIQSEHDGLVDFGCAERFLERARQLGNACELYRVEDRRNTHSWYTAGMFLERREENKTLDRFFSWIEGLDGEKQKREGYHAAVY